MNDQEQLKTKLPATYWKYRRGIAFICLAIAAIFVLGVMIVYSKFEVVADFPLVGFSTVFFAFLVTPIVIYMTGANREDLEKIKGIIEVLKK